jgi:hypothetical protein
VIREKAFFAARFFPSISILETMAHDFRAWPEVVLDGFPRSFENDGEEVPVSSLRWAG